MVEVDPNAVITLCTKRGEDNGGVEPPAQADLDDAEVRRGLGEGVEGEHGGDLEEADRRAGVGHLDLVDEPIQRRVVDEPAVDADALGRSWSVRRG